MNFFTCKRFKSTLVVIVSLFFLCLSTVLYAEDGYRLWLRYESVKDVQKLTSYKELIKDLVIFGNSPTMNAVTKELTFGTTGLLGKKIPVNIKLTSDGSILAGTLDQLKKLVPSELLERVNQMGEEGFGILTLKISQKKCIIITAKSDIGVLYGTYHFLKLLQTNQDINNLSIYEEPKIKLRLLNHWDNLDRTVERGYAGFSIWNWHKLPGYIDQRYIDYARANASIGINGTVLTNVNANALVLTPEYLIKVKALADAFRPYGIRVYLTARFSAPIELGKLKTADPLDSTVQVWWKNKIDEIYSYIPDFGGFLVKANSEGQPGPQNYGRNHADGANMLAGALDAHKGIVMWRAFVYDNNVPDDRAKQAYNEFKPLDGKFRKNVLVQVKNGPIDFQPREPFHPLFGTMPQTPLMMEFQVTQEYLGFSTNLVYLGTLFQECLMSDTYSKGKNSPVVKIIEGNFESHTLSGMAGVANIGNDINWCGHPFAQANWYALGRLAWNPEQMPETIARDWVRMTFSNSELVVKPVTAMMMASHEIAVNYMTPLGLHHIMGWSHHYGPGPWVKNKQRADWTAVYYHKADTLGIGFDRTESGSNALSQYAPEVQNTYKTLESCPEAFLLWFHRVPWDYKLKSGNTLWDEMCYKYYSGVDSVRWMADTWNSLEGQIDTERFNQVKMLLSMQEKEAIVWRNSCVLYFQTFSKRSIPSSLEKPEKSLEYYMNLKYSFVPGN